MNTPPPAQIYAITVIAVLVGMAATDGRPYLRLNLARTMFNRMVTDERLRTMDLDKV